MLRLIFVFCILFSVSAEAADKLIFQLGWIPTGERAQAYVAQRRGLFDAANLDVTILGGKGSTYMLTTLGTGVADVGEGTFDALLGAKVTSEVTATAILPVFTRVPDAVISSKARGITTMKDLVGKTVATAPFTSSNLPWPFVLQQNGIAPDSIKVLKADPTTLGGLLARGQVDGIILWVTSMPVVEPILKEAGTTAVVLPWSAYGFAGYSNSLFASQKALATKRDAVKRFVAAIKQAELLIRADPDRAAADVVALAPETDLAVVRGGIEVCLPLMFNEITERDGFGQFAPSLVETTWDWVSKEQGVPKDRLDPMKSVDFDISKSTKSVEIAK